MTYTNNKVVTAWHLDLKIEVHILGEFSSFIAKSKFGIINICKTEFAKIAILFERIPPTNNTPIRII